MSLDSHEIKPNSCLLRAQNYVENVNIDQNCDQRLNFIFVHFSL